jgi:serine/threonine protein kinase/tetratricopeptide (TPR) repeat protein
MVGQTLGHYKILDKLGVGGMGEVYRAEDTTLKRQVALKILPPELAESQERLDRFQREAKTLAALDHPNIVTIHTVEEADGVHFLTMQLVEGQPLSELIPKGGMPLERIFEIAIPLADALATAHEKGVIHRDLKPANIMVTDEGRVKVLDFGLAKLRQEAEAPLATELPTEPLTDKGQIVGTMPYMSPEQLEGKEIDARSDIFSLGVMLFEMATGERPFKGKSGPSLMSSILKDAPPDVDTIRGELPHHLARVIHRSLEKDPEDRYQSMKEVRNELRFLRQETDSQEVSRPAIPEPTKKRARWPLVAAVAGTVVVVAVLGALWLSRSQPPTEPPIEHPAKPVAAAEAQLPMIVVLPFENLGDPKDEYFADGMTEEITSRLAVVSGLRVISRTSAMQYKEDRPSLKQVGEELGVDYVLEGTVRWARTEDGSRVRITPQLIQVADDTHLWADAYDRVIDDIFEVQSDIATEVVSALGVTLHGEERAALDTRPTDSIEAYQAYLRALELLQGKLIAFESDQQIVDQLTRAVELDPGFTEAWALLCRHHSFLYRTGVDRTEERASRAKEALEGAERVDPDSPSTRVARGAFYYSVLQDTGQALRELETLAERYPNDPQVPMWIAQIYWDQGRLDEYKALAQRVTEVDPYNLIGWRFLAAYYRAMRRTEETLETYNRAIESAPTVDGLYVEKAAALRSLTGDLEAARSVLQQAPGNDSRAVNSGWINQRFWERKWDDLIELSDSLPTDNPWLASDAASWRASAMYLREGMDAARPEIEQALKTVATALETSEDAGGLHLWSAWLHSYIGDDEAAVREAEIALKLADGAGTRMSREEQLAAIYAAIGREDQALDILERLLGSNYPGAITVHELRLHPDWDPLRDHPRFQALLEKYGQEG